MAVWVAFLSGVFVGCCVGVFAIGMCNAARWSELERYLEDADE